MNIKYSFFIIDLESLPTLEDIAKFLESNNLKEKLSPELLWSAKKGELSNGIPMQRVYFDSHTYWAVAYQIQNRIEFIQQFLSKLSRVKPLKFGDKRMNKDKVVVKEISLNLDTILDKINSSRIESLTLEEKNFLDSYKD